MCRTAIDIHWLSQNFQRTYINVHLPKSVEAWFVGVILDYRKTVRSI